MTKVAHVVKAEKKDDVAVALKSYDLAAGNEAKIEALALAVKALAERG